jgi:hypothetical protein
LGRRRRDRCGNGRRRRTTRQRPASGRKRGLATAWCWRGIRCGARRIWCGWRRRATP